MGYIRGVVSFEPAGTEDWVSGVINRPITTGDKIWTDRNARAELHLGAATIRLSGETGFSFLDLNDSITQLRLSEGTMNVRVRRLRRDETFEVDTPNLAFSIYRPGQYRIYVNQNGDATTISVREGEGEITGGGSAYTLYSDESGTFRGYDQLDADIQAVGGEDDFDRWSYQRDRRFDHSISSRYVSEDAVGYEDLDDYGGWRPVPEYGTVWFPHVAHSDWAPYRYGHWDWIAPWGWTWVDDEPWGFAPFHYGRWVTVGGVWGWVPCAPRSVEYGGEYVRPVYAPALVAWVGGSGFSVGIGFGGGVNVGWFPLGPREVYVPSYPVSRTYVNNVNITNTTVNTTVVNNYYNNTVVNNNVTNVKYVNQSAPNAVTATSGATFSSAKPVSQNLIQVNQREIAAAPVAVTAPKGAPPKQAVLGGGAVATAKPPASVENRSVVAKNTPPPPPLSFEKQAAAIQQNGGKPLAVSQARQLQPARTQEAAVPVKIAPPSKPTAPRVDNAPSASTRQAQVQENSPNKNTAPNAAPPSPSNSNKPVAQNPGQAPLANPNRPEQGKNAARPQEGNPNRSNAQNPAQVPQTNSSKPEQERNTPQPPQGNPNRPPAPNPGQTPQNNPNKPEARPNATQQPPRTEPNNAPPAQAPRMNNDRPPVNPPTRSTMPDPKIEEKHQQELQQLQQKQDQERQKVEQEHRQQQLAVQEKNASEQKQRQMQQELQRQQQQKLQELEKRHAQEQEVLRQKQEQEHKLQQQPKQPPKPEPQTKKDPSNRDDRPPNR
ncbi:MAG: hypothetical protein PVS2B2_06450 [Candidatus Acidiferrum sp.]